MPVNVAMIDPSLFTLPYDLALCRALRARGCDVALYGRPVRRLETIPDDCRAISYFYRYSERLKDRIPTTLFQVTKGLEHAVDMVRLLEVLRQGRDFVVHFQWSPLPTVDTLIIDRIRRTVGPVVLTAHDVKPFNNAPTSALQRLGSTAIWKMVDHVIVHSEASRILLLRDGLAPAKVSVVAHGVINTNQACSALKADREVVTILLFGRVKPYKGIDVMVEAIGSLSDDLRSRCRVLVVGEPRMPIEPLKNRAAELGIAANMIWDLRYVSDADMADVFSQADIFAFPYREIDTSGVLMACLPYAKPIIASAIGAFPKILRDGVHGRIVPPEDPAALSGAIKELVSDPEKRERYGGSVSQLCGEVPTWDAIAGQTIEIYQKVRWEWVTARAA